MSFYEPQGWQAPARQASWEQPPPPSRSGASSTSQREDSNAFATQFEEVDRAMDNLVKSGKFYTPGPRPSPMSMPAGRPGVDFVKGPRMYGGRHGDFDPSRPHPGANLQNFYASQRHQGRQPDADQMMQAKRRMAAQRERELRNYHQEQQYNRKGLLAEMSSNKSDRSMSPNNMSEEERRELIARQHRALYGEAGAFVNQIPFTSEDAANRDPGATVHPAPGGAVRGPSPLGGDHFGVTGQAQQGESNVQGAGSGPDGARIEKASSPSTQGSSGFGNLDASIHSSGQAPTPPSGDDSSHARHMSKSTTAPVNSGMGPIGSRPNAQQATSQTLNKRTTSPLPPALGYGFGPSDQNADRVNSAAPASNATKESSSNPGSGAWGTGSGVWGSNKIGTTSVWG